MLSQGVTPWLSIDRQLVHNLFICNSIVSLIRLIISYLENSPFSFPAISLSEFRIHQYMSLTNQYSVFETLSLSFTKLVGNVTELGTFQGLSTKLLSSLKKILKTHVTESQCSLFYLLLMKNAHFYIGHHCIKISLSDQLGN